MDPSISHDFSDEGDEAKALWFQSLSLDERMDYFCSITDLALCSKKAAGRKKDLEDVKLLELKK